MAIFQSSWVIARVPTEHVAKCKCVNTAGSPPAIFSLGRRGTYVFLGQTPNSSLATGWPGSALRERFLCHPLQCCPFTNPDLSTSRVPPSTAELRPGWVLGQQPASMSLSANRLGRESPLGQRLCRRPEGVLPEDGGKQGYCRDREGGGRREKK